MVPVTSLWLAVVLSAVLVFIASSVIHMMLGYHKRDWKVVPAEDEVMESLRRFNIPPGDYMIPCARSMAAMKDPKFLEKLQKGPRLVMTMMSAGVPSMGPQLLKWFVYCAVVSTFAAYLTSRAVGPGAPYLEVFRFAGTTAFAAYSLAHWQESIWYKKSIGTTIRNNIDGLVYGMLTAGVFGWLWPR